MKILYAVQATGNGHISRAIQLVPFLRQMGEVDVFLSGSNSSLSLDFPVRYRSKGISLFNHSSGGLDYYKIARSNPWIAAWRESRELPVEKYDLVLNDFEPITSMACRWKRKKSIQLSHQACFQSKRVPRPSKVSLLGEWILGNYSTSTRYYGFHFRPYEEFILPPVIQSALIGRRPSDQGHITVYLPGYGKDFFEKSLRILNKIPFHCFLKDQNLVEISGNILFIPIGQQDFRESLLSARAVITGAGFETPAEALYLRKRLMCIPCKNHYEQYCNAAALEKLGIYTLDPASVKELAQHIETWLSLAPVEIDIQPNNLGETVQLLADTYRDFDPFFTGFEPGEPFFKPIPASA